jgi:hypothetical protein
MTLTGSNTLIAILVLLYALFWAWHGGIGSPLTPQEIDRFMAKLTPKLRAIYRSLAEQDDGREFYMVNLVRHRKKAVYPDGFDYDDDVKAADRRYVRGILPQLLKRAAYPVFVGQPHSSGFIVTAEPQGIAIQAQEIGPWDLMFIVRHRSRRDFLDLVTDPDMIPVGIHKWASVARTQAFPASPYISSFAVRSAVAVVFVVVGVLLHVILRRFGWYGAALSS